MKLKHDKFKRLVRTLHNASEGLRDMRRKAWRGARYAAEDLPAVALAGNPNVGKSTLFNCLTGLKQHTGNWTGKTVESARGVFQINGVRRAIVDLPGCYSLNSASPEEVVARDYIAGGDASCIVIVCDASCLSRNLGLVLQTLALTKSVVVCVNLIDEAARHGIRVDTNALSKLLGVQAVATDASHKRGVDELLKAVNRVITGEFLPSEGITGFDDAESLFGKAEEISAAVTMRDADVRSAARLRLDCFLTGKFTGTAVMLLLLGLVFYITITLANYPSQLLDKLLFGLIDRLRTGMDAISVPAKVTSALCDGVLATLFRVVSVMLPPMAIFFPLFTLLEDLGYLPRVAFNLDSAFRRCSSCGKQALTMCMGFGCNAAGVVGCRIIESPRERLTAILTNSLVPCNGRFPTLIALTAAFFAAGAGGMLGGAVSALCMLAALLIGVGATFFMSWLLSKTLLRGKASSFVLELPPFRKPRVGQVIVRSVLDRTLFVLGRAAAAAAPAGLFIWVLANINVDGISLLSHAVSFLDPIGGIMGLDGAILAAFLLALPANELVVPLLIMIYLGKGMITDYSQLFELKLLLTQNGWTIVTAINVILLMLFHSPCTTTLLTIKKETGSLKWTAVSFLLPSALGVVCCLAVNGAAELVRAVLRL